MERWGHRSRAKIDWINENKQIKFGTLNRTWRDSRLKRIFAGIITFLVFFSSIEANAKYFQRVVKTAKTYRVEASQNDMKVVSNEEGNRLSTLR